MKKEYGWQFFDDFRAIRVCRRRDSIMDIKRTCGRIEFDAGHWEKRIDLFSTSKSERKGKL